MDDRPLRFFADRLMVPGVADDPEVTEVRELAPSDLEAPSGDHTEVPQPPPVPGEPAAGRRTRRSKAKRSARQSAPHLSEIGREEKEGESESITEREVTRAFFYSYRLFCRLVGARPEATIVEFNQFGRAWIDLFKKVPGIKIVVTLLGPAVTLAELLDRFESAWSSRTRFRDRPRPRWGKAAAESPAAAPDFQVVNGAPGAP